MTDLMKKTGRRSDLLKLIALVTMLIDHVGVLLYPGEMTFRTIGRIAFPIFAYMLAEGFIYTSDRWRYARRLLYFALIAQVPYMFLNADMVRETNHYNVLFLLLYGLLCLVVAEKIGTYFKEKQWVLLGLSSVLLVFLVALPDVVEFYLEDFAFSYASYGLVLMLIFYVFKKKPYWILPAFLLTSLFFTYKLGVVYRVIYYSPEMTFLEGFLSFDLIWQQITDYENGLWTLSGYFFQVRSVMGIILILIFGNYPKGPVKWDWLKGLLYPPLRLPRWLAYVFYPLHISLILALRIYLGGPLN